MRDCFRYLLAVGLAQLATFNPQPLHAQTPTVDYFNPGANNSVQSLAVQADGKILVGGYFSTLGGQTRRYLGRLNPDGTLDAGFDPEVGNPVDFLAVQADGQILVGGRFTTLGGQPRNYLGRLNPDGTLDTGFDPGVDNLVHSLAVQADGKILLGGDFTRLGGQPRNRIGRLNPDGTLDTGFTGDTGFDPGASSSVLSLAVQADGQILVGGRFTTLGGQPRSNIGRLNPDGTLDTGFNPGANMEVVSLAVQADGQILVGGWFTTLGGQTRNRIGRLNPDGTLDAGFNPGANDFVFPLALQADGKILLGGYFTKLGGESRNRIGRLNPDGTLDAGFNPGASSDVFSLAVQADGKILVGGSLTKLGGESRSRIGRLNNTTPATQSLSYDGTTLTWLRGGSSPEVWRTTFEWSADGQSWTPLDEGTRIPGGWKRTDAHVPVDATIRARGFVAGGRSGWFVESFATNLPGPDLVAVSWDTPLQTAPGRSVAVAWTLVNRGRLPATDAWVDRVYLSPDPATTNGWLLGEFPVSGPLATNAPLARAQSVTLPETLEPDRDYWWILVTDATEALIEENEANNTRVSEQPMRLRAALVPVIESAEILAAGQVKLTAAGMAGIRYTVEASQDLTAWEAIGTATAEAGGRLEFTDPAAAGLSMRFYRLKGP